MTVRPPRSFDPSGGMGTGMGTGLSALEYELIAEQASALGRAGLAAEAALENLRQAASPDTVTYERLVDTAAEAVWALFIQREISGMRNDRAVIARYRIPGAVLARLGARPRHPAA